MSASEFVYKASSDAPLASGGWHQAGRSENCGARAEKKDQIPVFLDNQAKGRPRKPVLRISPRPYQRLRSGLPPTVASRCYRISARGTGLNARTAARNIPAANTLSTSRLTSAETNREIKTAQVPPIAARDDSEPQENAMLFQGDYWKIRYAGKDSILEDTRGLRYIALLIREAGQGPMYAAELVAFASGNHPSAVELENNDPVIDSAAENLLVKRLEEIGFERNSASAQNDYATVAALDEEVDRITEELERARSPHKRRGNRAIFSNSAERARKAVSKAISETISKMVGYSALEPLAGHLTAAIQKGQWLSYNGKGLWHIDFQFPVAKPDRTGTRLQAAAGRS